MIALKSKLQEDMKGAMKAKDAKRLNAIRQILAALKQIEIDERIEVDEERLFQILNKMLKQRNESLKQYESAKRNDLAEQENYEINLISSYLPEPLSDTEIMTLISTAIKHVGASSPKDIGKVIGEVKLHLKGRADLLKVSEKIKIALSQLFP